MDTALWRVDAIDFFRLSAAFRRLPATIKLKVVNRAMRRMQTMGRTRVVRLASKRIKLPQKHVRAATSLPMGTGMRREITVKSDWIPLGKLKPRQGKRGVSVPMRGSFRSAFIASMSNGHSGVFKRVGKARLPIRELYGPNPANDIATSPEPYQELLEELIVDELGGRLLHELSRALPG